MGVGGHHKQQSRRMWMAKRRCDVAGALEAGEGRGESNTEKSRRRLKGEDAESFILFTFILVRSVHMSYI